jgi:hypothetical protein
MSTVDAWEYERRNGRVQRRKPYQAKKKNHKREVQLTMKLYGGTTAKDKGEPLNDDIDFIGR